MIAHRFSMDPIVVLKSGYFEWAVRVAAANHVNAVEAEASRKNGSQQQAQQVTVPNWIG